MMPLHSIDSTANPMAKNNILKPKSLSVSYNTPTKVCKGFVLWHLIWPCHVKVMVFVK